MKHVACWLAPTASRLLIEFYDEAYVIFRSFRVVLELRHSGIALAYIST